MNDKDRILFQKIAKYIASAGSYTAGLSYDVFCSTSIVVDATAFTLGQIGELTKLLSDDVQKENPSIPWHKIRGLRNRIVHDYENLDMRMLWETVRDNLPELEQAVKKLLEKR